LLVTFLKKLILPIREERKISIKTKKTREKIKDDCRFWQHQNYTETTKNIKER